MLWPKLLTMTKEIKKNARSLSRDEMKKVKGGLAAADAKCKTNPCKFFADSKHGWVEGKCDSNSNGDCVCDARPIASIVASECKLEVIIIGG